MGKLIIKVIQLLCALSLIFATCSCSISTVDSNGHLPALGVGRAESGTSTLETETESDAPVVVPKRGITICVDPGHGYDDGGTSSEFLGDTLEKDVNLSVAMKLKGHLDALGFDVIMTHDGESFPVSAIDDGNNKFRPEERVSYANSLGSKIDYYISVHCNAFDDEDVHGAIVYYYEGPSKGTVGDAEAATDITEHIAESFEDAKVSSNIGQYYVIKYTQVPASLVEIGFVTNKSDAENMLDDEWKDKFAKALADGIEDFYTEDEPEETTGDDSETDTTAETDAPAV